LVNKILSYSENKLEDYISMFNPSNDKEFLKLISYISDNIVLAKHNEAIELDYIFSNMKYLWNNYEEIVSEIDKYLPTFKFLELNSVSQSIILLSYVENKVIQTPKNVLIKESIFLADTFDSKNSTKLINAVLDKVLN
jgi:transcription termination factor NusB